MSATRCPSCDLDVGEELARAGLCPVCSDPETLRRAAPELVARLDELCEDTEPGSSSDDSDDKDRS